MKRLTACAASLFATSLATSLAHADSRLVLQGGFAATRHTFNADVPFDWNRFEDKVPGRIAPTVRIDVGYRFAADTAIGVHVAIGAVSGSTSGSFHNYYQPAELGITLHHTAADAVWVAPWAGVWKPYGCESHAPYTSPDYNPQIKVPFTKPCEKDLAYGLSVGVDLFRGSDGMRFSVFGAATQTGLGVDVYDSLSAGLMVRFQPSPRR